MYFLPKLSVAYAYDDSSWIKTTYIHKSQLVFCFVMQSYEGFLYLIKIMLAFDNYMK